MAEHTKGPWRWFVQGNGDVYLATEHSGRLIVMDFVRHRMQSAIARFRDHALCVMFKADHWVSDATHGTIEHPDARLIAAAPELLAACKATHEVLLTFERLGLLAQPHEQGSLELVRAAINKAHGSS